MLRTEMKKFDETVQRVAEIIFDKLLPHKKYAEYAEIETEYGSLVYKNKFGQVESFVTVGERRSTIATYPEDILQAWKVLPNALRKALDLSQSEAAKLAAARREAEIQIASLLKEIEEEA